MTDANAPSHTDRRRRRIRWLAGLALIAGILTLAQSFSASDSLSIVIVPVADLRAAPGPLATRPVHDPNQESQLLYGEQVRVLKIRDGWAMVEATEQPEYSHSQRWQGYPGWIPQRWLLPARDPLPTNAVVTVKWAPIHGPRTSFAVPLGTRLMITGPRGPGWSIRLADGAPGSIARDHTKLDATLQAYSTDQRRRAILAAAEQLLGDPYFWGGRSPHTSQSGAAPVTGVDCSGLVNLAYRAAGVAIPRDAHEQRLRARPLDHPQPADLVFLSKANDPTHIVHVMIYAGDGLLLEAPGTGEVVRRISVIDRLGRPIERIEPGSTIKEQTVWFGTYLP